MILVTGASGFVGSALVDRLIRDSYPVRGVFRSAVPSLKNCDIASIDDINGETRWQESLKSIDTIIHTAARVHVMNEVAVNPLEEFRRINVEGTINLARQAAKAGVRRFIFLSSVKVNGESTVLGAPFKASDAAAPADAYGISKMEAENFLLALSKETGMEVVIIRPPLIYGQGVKANFHAMMSLVSKGYPWPIRPNRNKRSLVYLENLVDLIVCCIAHPSAANKIFLVSDDKSYSTAGIVEHIALAMNKRVYLFPIPRWLVKALATLIGKTDVYQRVYGNLEVDISSTKSSLGWAPPIDSQEAFNRTVKCFSC
jgi:nucleoside-diphosphate-sugar epimerase